MARWQVELPEVGRILDTYHAHTAYVAYVQATLAEWAKDDNLVYHGNAGQELLREVPHVLKVRLMYPIEARIQIIMQRFKYTREQAQR